MSGGARAALHTEPQKPETRKFVSSGSREAGNTRVRKLTVDVPTSLHDEYEDLYFDLRRVHRKLKRVEYAPLVLRYGLDRKKIEAELAAPTNQT